MTQKKIFDYIICGCGTAGSVLAKELTDDKKTSVLVLEDGTNLDDTSASSADIGRTSSSNKYTTLRISSTSGIGTIPLRQANGRAIGGSSSTNFTGWYRGIESFMMNGQISSENNGVTPKLVSYFKKLKPI